MLMEFRNKNEFRNQIIDKVLYIWFNTNNEETGLSQEKQNKLREFVYTNYMDNLLIGIDNLEWTLVEDGTVYTESSLDEMPTLWIESSDVWDDIENGDFDSVCSLFDELLVWLILNGEDN